jgi:hypothetical protein
VPGKQCLDIRLVVAYKQKFNIRTLFKLSGLLLFMGLLTPYQHPNGIRCGADLENMKGFKMVEADRTYRTKHAVTIIHETY